MIYLRVKNKEGDFLINSFTEELNIFLKDKNTRYFKNEFEFGILEIFIKNEEKFIRSNKNFNALVGLLSDLIPILLKNFSKSVDDIIDEHLHNIIKIHGNQKSIIERCVYSSVQNESYTDFIESVEKNIKNNSNEVALDICELSKEIQFMDYHLGGYRLLNAKKMEKTLTSQNLKKILLSLSHNFFHEFKKNNIIMSLHEVDENIFCNFEYETFNIAMHCFLQDAVKYAKPGSKIHVKTNNEKRQLIFSMDSVKIERNEMEKIFEKGIFGINTPEEFRGEGIGMYTFKKALDRSNIEIYIDPDYVNNENYNGTEYVRNIFRFTFSIWKYN